MDPRGRRAHRCQPVRDGTCEPVEVKARVVAYVHTGSSRFRNDFRQACRQLALDAHEVKSAAVELTAADREAWRIPVRGNQSAGAKWITVYVVRGTGKALGEFAKRKGVARTHGVLPGRVAYRGTGSGDKPKRRRRHPLDERLDAIRERDEAADAEKLRLRNS